MLIDAQNYSFSPHFSPFIFDPYSSVVRMKFYDSFIIFLIES